jgi:hypothetical protein
MRTAVNWGEAAPDFLDIFCLNDVPSLASHLLRDVASHCFLHRYKILIKYLLSI